MGAETLLNSLASKREQTSYRFGIYELMRL